MAGGAAPKSSLPPVSVSSSVFTVPSFHYLTFLLFGCCGQEDVARAWLPPHAGAGPKGLAVAYPHQFISLTILPFISFQGSLNLFLPFLVHNALKGHSLDLIAFPDDSGVVYPTHAA